MVGGGIETVEAKVKGHKGRRCLWDGKESLWARWREAAGGWGGGHGRDVGSSRPWPHMSRHGIWTEVAKCRAMNLVTMCKVARMRKLPGQGGQAGPLNEISFEELRWGTWQWTNANVWEIAVEVPHNLWNERKPTKIPQILRVCGK